MNLVLICDAWCNFFSANKEIEEQRQGEVIKFTDIITEKGKNVSKFAIDTIGCNFLCPCFRERERPIPFFYDTLSEVLQYPTSVHILATSDSHLLGLYFEKVSFSYVKLPLSDHLMLLFTLTHSFIKMLIFTFISCR